MGIPQVTITKSDGNTGAVRQSNTGVLAIIAPAVSGSQNVPSSFARQADVLSSFGESKLAEYAAYDMSIAGKPTLLVRPTTATAASYQSLVTSGVTGTSAVTNGSAAGIVDDFDVTFTVGTGGTIGVAGITFTYSLDGVNTSALQALGAANTVNLPLPANAGGGASGAILNFGAGTLVAGDVVTFSTKSAAMNGTDLATSLTALGSSAVPWEAVLIDGDAATGTTGQVDLWLAGLEARGIFRMAFLNTRSKNLPVPATESEAAFLTAMTTFASASNRSIRVSMGTDHADSVSPVSGLTRHRPVSMFEAARAMAVPLGQDLGFVAAGPVDDCSIQDANNNPKWHNEDINPGLDALGFTTLRTVNGQNGVYITNGNVFSAAGSDFVFVQHVRTMNRACEIAFAQLTRDLGLGVGKKPPDPVTGGIYIAESDASNIDTSVTTAVRVALKGQVVDAAFTLSRTDDISANSGATVHGELQIEALAYIKGIAVTAKFVKTIAIGGV